MKTYIALLRGINVSGQKMIKMEALRKMFYDLKFKNVRSYIQSGNIVFENKKTPSSTLEKKIQEQIHKTFSFEVAVIVKEVDELINAVKNNPFIKNKDADPGRIYITLLSEKPEESKIDKINELQFAPDEFIILKDVVYVFVSKGYGNSKLNNNFFENKLKVKATTRNWKTINELIKISGKN